MRTKKKKKKKEKKKSRVLWIQLGDELLEGRALNDVEGLKVFNDPVNQQVVAGILLLTAVRCEQSVGD